MDNIIQAKLNIDWDQKHVRAQIQFLNTGHHSAYLWEANTAQNGVVHKDLFEIICAQQKIDYTGMIVKREHPSAADFIELQPKATYTSTLLLDRYYAFLEKNALYTIRYTTFNPDISGIGFSKIESNSVSMEINRSPA